NCFGIPNLALLKSDDHSIDIIIGDVGRLKDGTGLLLLINLDKTWLENNKKDSLIIYVYDRDAVPSLYNLGNNILAHRNLILYHKISHCNMHPLPHILQVHTPLMSYFYIKYNMSTWRRTLERGGGRHLKKRVDIYTKIIRHYKAGETIIVMDGMKMMAYLSHHFSVLIFTVFMYVIHIFSYILLNIELYTFMFYTKYINMPNCILMTFHSFNVGFSFFLQYEMLNINLVNVYAINFLLKMNVGFNFFFLCIKT
ncbi:hypothetical protein ACJX0J_012688, partial [Zea mays]